LSIPERSGFVAAVIAVLKLRLMRRAEPNWSFFTALIEKPKVFETGTG